MSKWSFFYGGGLAHKLDRPGLHSVDIDAIRAKYGPPAPPAPLLLTPVSNAQIPQNDSSNGCSLNPNAPRRGFGYKISFDWANVSGATQYNLVVQHQGATIPLVDVVVSQSSYLLVQCGGFVIDSNLTNWHWQVRSFTNNISGDFSSARPFEFLACRLLDGTACDTVAGPLLQVNGSGQLTGALGVNVGGTLYDVAFMEGTCVAVFSGCDQVSDFTFQTQAGAALASAALLSTVFLDVPPNFFDSVMTSTVGCKATNGCSIYTPYGPASSTQSSNAFNAVVNSLDAVVQAGLSPTTSTSAIPSGAVYAKWSLSSLH
jgi:hypothetical protein